MKYMGDFRETIYYTDDKNQVYGYSTVLYINFSLFFSLQKYLKISFNVIDEEAEIQHIITILLNNS